MIEKQLKLLERPKKEVVANSLFEDCNIIISPKWRDMWWGMPEYTMEDCTPFYQITVSFLSKEDLDAFIAKLELGDNSLSTIRRCKNAMWYPTQPLFKPRRWVYTTSNKPQPRYPIYIPSKGRPQCITAKYLKEMEIPFFVVVEPHEYKLYSKTVGKQYLLKLPFKNLGKGSIPARNWIWQHALDNKAERHWVIDDNIQRFFRLNLNRRISVDNAAIFCAAEDFSDRYTNIGLSGFNYMNFACTERSNKTPVLYLNTRVYSMILVNNALKYRWRGRYNEDTDLSLRVLKGGWCTILFNSFLGQKYGTQKMKGGNTDNVYNTNDHRLAFAKSLQKQHPRLVKVVWRYNRWHHEVNYSIFRRNKLILRKGIVPTRSIDNYGMELARRE